eukprot:1275557-Amphidinium_carterae.1
MGEWAQRDHCMAVCMSAGATCLAVSGCTSSRKATPGWGVLQIPGFAVHVGLLDAERTDKFAAK